MKLTLLSTFFVDFANRNVCLVTSSSIMGENSTISWWTNSIMILALSNRIFPCIMHQPMVSLKPLTRPYAIYWRRCEILCGYLWGSFVLLNLFRVVSRGTRNRHLIYRFRNHKYDFMHKSISLDLGPELRYVLGRCTSWLAFLYITWYSWRSL